MWNMVEPIPTNNNKMKDRMNLNKDHVFFIINLCKYLFSRFSLTICWKPYRGVMIMERLVIVFQNSAIYQLTYNSNIISASYRDMGVEADWF